MFDSDLLIAFGIMGVLFLRQIAILKEPNKIDYAPLLLGIGTVSSIIHFMIHPDTNDLLLLSRESLVPLLVAVILYIILNILHQTQDSLESRHEDEFGRLLVQEISQLKRFILDLEERMNTVQRESVQTQREVREKFVEDIGILSSIEVNQKKFLEQFLQLEQWHEDIKILLKYFSEEQVPKLDEVVNRHINIFRISEQDHYNKIQKLLKKAIESRFDISDELHSVEKKLETIVSLTTTVTDKIVTATTQELSFVMKDFEKELLLLKSNAGVVATSLHESENVLINMRTESELVMKQMILSAKKLESVEDFKDVINDIERIQSDYTKSQAKLGFLIKELQMDFKEEIEAIDNRFDNLSQELCEKIDSSLENLQKHYHTIGEDVTQKANLLAKQALIHTGYSDRES